MLRLPVRLKNYIGLEKFRIKKKSLPTPLIRVRFLAYIRQIVILEWLLLILAKDKVGEIVFSGDNDLPKSDYFSGEKVLCLAEDDVELSESKEKTCSSPKI